MIKKTLRYCC